MKIVQPTHRTLFESVFPSIRTMKSSQDEQRIETKSSAGPESTTSCGFVTLIVSDSANFLAIFSSWSGGKRGKGLTARSPQFARYPNRRHAPTLAN